MVLSAVKVWVRGREIRSGVLDIEVDDESSWEFDAILNAFDEVLNLSLLWLSVPSTTNE